MKLLDWTQLNMNIWSPAQRTGVWSTLTGRTPLTGFRKIVFLQSQLVTDWSWLQYHTDIELFPHWSKHPPLTTATRLRKCYELSGVVGMLFVFQPLVVKRAFNWMRCRGMQCSNCQHLLPALLQGHALAMETNTPCPDEEPWDGSCLQYCLGDGRGSGWVWLWHV